MTTTATKQQGDGIDTEALHDLAAGDQRARSFYGKLASDLARQHDRAMAKSEQTEPAVKAAEAKVEKLEAQLERVKRDLEAAREAQRQAWAADSEAVKLWQPVDELLRMYGPDAAEAVGLQWEDKGEPPELDEYLGIWRRYLGPITPGPKSDVMAAHADALHAAGVPALLIERALRRRRAWLDELRKRDPALHHERLDEIKGISEGLLLLKTW